MSDVPPSPDAHRTSEISLDASSRTPPPAPRPPAYPSRSSWEEAIDHDPPPPPDPDLRTGGDPDSDPVGHLVLEPDEPAAPLLPPAATNTSIFEPRPEPAAAPGRPQVHLSWPSADGDADGPGNHRPGNHQAGDRGPVVRLEGSRSSGLNWAETTTIGGIGRPPSMPEQLPWTADDGLGRVVLGDGSMIDDAFVDEVMLVGRPVGSGGLKAFTRDRAQVLYRRQSLLAAVGLVVLATVGAVTFPRSWRDPGPGLAIDTGDGTLEADVVDDHPLLQQPADEAGGGQRATNDPASTPTSDTRAINGASTDPSDTTEPPVDESGPETSALVGGNGTTLCPSGERSSVCGVDPAGPTTHLVDSASSTEPPANRITTTSDPTSSTARSTTTESSTTTTPPTTSKTRPSTTTRRTTTTRPTATTRPTTTRQTTTTQPTTTTTRPTSATTTTRPTVTTSPTTTEPTTTTSTASTTEATTTVVGSTTETEVVPPGGSAVQCTPEPGDTTTDCLPIP